jgi:hypothetical protein
MSREPKHGVANTTQDVLTHHSNAFGDIVSTMADFTAESKLFTPEGLLRGPEALRGFRSGFSDDGRGSESVLASTHRTLRPLSGRLVAFQT